MLCGINSKGLIIFTSATHASAAHAATLPGWLCLFSAAFLGRCSKCRAPLHPESQCVFSILLQLHDCPLRSSLFTSWPCHTLLSLSNLLKPWWKVPWPCNSCTLHTHKASFMLWLQDPLPTWTVTRLPAEVVEYLVSWEMNSGEIMTWTVRVRYCMLSSQSSFSEDFTHWHPWAYGGKNLVGIWNALVVSFQLSWFAVLGFFPMVPISPVATLSLGLNLNILPFWQRPEFLILLCSLLLIPTINLTKFGQQQPFQILEISYVRLLCCL